MNKAICLATTLLVIRVVVGGWKKCRGFRILDRKYVTLPAANHCTSFDVCSSQMSNVIYYVINPSLGS